MAKQKLTPWFPPEVTPVRRGVYLSTICRDEIFYRYWDGHNWLIGGSTPREAARVPRDGLINSTPMHWRGLTKEQA